MKKCLFPSVLVICMTFTACGNTVAMGNEEDNKSIVEITVADEWVGHEINQESLDQSVVAVGYESAVLNSDGSVTYTMSREKQQEILSGLKESMEYYCNDIRQGESSIESFKDVTYDENMTKFDVYVDKEMFSYEDTQSAYLFYMSGVDYQAFSGIAGKEIDVQVNYIDIENNDILASERLSDSTKN